uniref:PIN2 (TERF1) interacting telomerase inhibitor 1 n=1 Tax=Gasterosteus aculeatus TaxID=69293 RepID=G3P9N5_GASAC
KDPEMAMLAAPRKKVKWSVDPRNTSWSNDESKFGHKMMERMGWSKGKKGLGRSEQGSTENIKVKVKNDNYGLGTMASYEDNWIAHQDDFNELLAQLNNCHGQNGSAETPPVEEAKGFSLEEKSKTSKKRVHYMKFTKGKDLSSRSETDLNCIFGKRGKAAKSQEQAGSGSNGDPQAERTEDQVPATRPDTVKSALTMQEYFARRMADLKRASEEAPSTETNETSGPTNEPVIVIDDGGGEQDDEDERGDSSGKKKKKRKVNENCGAPSGGEQNCEALPPSKKKKKQQQHEGTELLNGHGPTDDHAVDSEVVDKKKPIEKPGDEIKEEELVAKKSKKDKKKKK